MTDKPAKVFDFKEQLALAQRVEDEGIFDKYYNHIWEGMIDDIHFHKDLRIQKLGIDKTITFKDCVRITVDEKFDRYPRSGNVFIELFTDINNNVKGWLYKNECDYVVYGFSDGSVTWLPMKALRMLWFYHQHADSHDWMNDKSVKFIKNKGYEGMGVLVNRERLEYEIYTKTTPDLAVAWDRVCPYRKGWLWSGKNQEPKEWRVEDRGFYGKR